MVASKKTMEDVKSIVLEHLTLEQAQALVVKLRRVSGNKSFEDTIILLEKILK